MPLKTPGVIALWLLDNHYGFPFIQVCFSRLEKAPKTESPEIPWIPGCLPDRTNVLFVGLCRIQTHQNYTVQIYNLRSK